MSKRVNERVCKLILTQLACQSSLFSHLSYLNSCFITNLKKNKTSLISFGENKKPLHLTQFW